MKLFELQKQDEKLTTDQSLFFVMMMILLLLLLFLFFLASFFWLFLFFVLFYFYIIRGGSHPCKLGVSQSQTYCETTPQSVWVGGSSQRKQETTKTRKHSSPYSFHLSHSTTYKTLCFALRTLTCAPPTTAIVPKNKKYQISSSID